LPIVFSFSPNHVALVDRFDQKTYENSVPVLDIMKQKKSD